MKEIRLGYGEDIHPLIAKRKLILSGVEIPFSQGLKGHSDADVVFHAVSDALLGSLALGDLGKLFPPSDPATEGIASSIIVEKCLSLVEKEGYRVNNVDVSIAAEAPHLAPYIEAMRASLAKVLKTDLMRLSLKAMTNEGFDAVGKGLAIRATAVVSVIKE
jgi:2-C-methyl-D-erythritol 2,4-cyclodiphosphate synthase